MHGKRSKAVAARFRAFGEAHTAGGIGQHRLRLLPIADYRVLTVHQYARASHKTKGSDHMTTDTTRNTAAKPTTGTGSRPRRHTPTAAAGGWYDQRVIVPLPAPVTCPHCGASSTCARNGVRYNLRTAMRMESRVCSACHFSFTGARPMTREERQRRGVA